MKPSPAGNIPRRTRGGRAVSIVGGFTLIELLVAAVVFLILAILIAQLISSATLITGLSNKKQSADAQARTILARMALDFGKMLKRSDVDYELTKQPGNDRMAFLAEVAGYYPPTASPSPLSVVAYRLTSTNSGFEGFQRYGKGLSWLTDASGEAAPVFHQKIATFSPEAVSSGASDEFEEIGPGVIRFETIYLLKNGKLSETPWDANAGHGTVDGLKDVAAIGVVLAVIDPTLIGRLTPDEIRALAAKLADFSSASMPAMGDLERSWQQTADADGVTRKSGGAVRIHARYFPLNP